MNVYLDPLTSSRGIQRVVDALIKYKPSSVTIVSDPKKADMQIIHVFGRYDKVKNRIADLQADNTPYAMIQYCLRSTQKPHTRNWVRMWEQAQVVWSYYDLQELLREDFTSDYQKVGEMVDDHHLSNFYYAPLGVDADVFQQVPQANRDIVIAASSQHALAESARECAFATKRVNGKMFFLGHDLRRGDDIICMNGISDEQLASWYSRCVFVSGLRRCEGFELPVLEGALCGARPILFDRPHYRHWFNDFAIFIPEIGREDVIDILEDIFKKDPFQFRVSEDEKKSIQQTFHWETIINGFWERIICQTK